MWRLIDLEYHISVPTKDVSHLKVGDIVWINGEMYTLRDMAHRRLRSLQERNIAPPFDLDGACIYHAGPIAWKVEGGWVICSIGPTTSGRMSALLEATLSAGAKLIVGKGGFEPPFDDLFREYSSTYLSFVGGAGVIAASSVVKVKDVYWMDLGIPEAVWHIEVKNFGPCIVSIDAMGENLYTTVHERARNFMKDYNKKRKV